MDRVLQHHARQNALNICGAVLILIAIFVSWHASKRQGQDFGVLYATAVGIATGAPIYDPEWQKLEFQKWGLPQTKSVPYPPSSGFFTLPFAAFSYPVAQSLWFVLLTAAVIFGVRGLIRISLPSSPASIWMFSAGTVLLSACIRWGMTPLQGAPLMFGLLAALVVALHTNRPRLALLVVTCVTAVKFTIAFPFLALLVLHRRYWMLAQSIALVGLLNILGFARVGGWVAIGDYRKSLREHEAINTVDSPDPWDTQSVPRLDWTYMLNGLFGSFDVFRIIAVLTFGLVCLWLLLRSQSLKRTPVTLNITAVFLSAMICINLLAVYHHHYDVSPLLVPLIIMFARRDDVTFFNSKVTMYLIAPLAVMMALAPIAVTQTLATKLMGAFGYGLFNMTFPIATTMMLVASLMLVHQITGERSSGTHAAGRTRGSGFGKPSNGQQ